MLTKEEALNANKLAAEVGERKFGHFDHDAPMVSGPRDVVANTLSPSRRPRSAEPAIVFTERLNTSTGRTELAISLE